MNEKKIFPILINRNIEAPKYIQAYYIIIRLKNVSISDMIIFLMIHPNVGATGIPIYCFLGI